MKKRFKVACSVIIGLALSVATPPVLARDILLCIDDIQWGSPVKDPGGCIDVQSWSWSIDSPEPTSGGTRRRGAVEVGDLVVVKEADKASAALLLGMLQGRIFKTASLIVRACPAGCDTTPLPLVTITLDNVLITRLDMGGTAGARPTESLSLNFETVEYCYQEINEDGSAGGEFCSQYTIQEGV